MTDYDGSAVPIRTADDWRTTEVDGERRAVLVQEREPRNRLDAFLFDLFGADRTREITLDPVGTTVWERSDGEHTLDEVAQAVATSHDANRVEPVDRTLGQFLLQLRDRDLLRIEPAQ